MAGKVVRKASKATSGKVRKVTRYVLAGCGGRGTSMFGVPLAKDYPGTASLVGLFDLNRKRMAASAKMIGNCDLPQYNDFDRMLAEVDFDAVAIATRDCSHAFYIDKTLRPARSPSAKSPSASTPPSAARSSRSRRKPAA